jgi:hypothetical protein
MIRFRNVIVRRKLDVYGRGIVMAPQSLKVLMYWNTLKALQVSGQRAKSGKKYISLRYVKCNQEGPAEIRILNSINYWLYSTKR